MTKLSELQFPICLMNEHSIVSGKHLGFGSYRYFRLLRSETFISGAWDAFMIVDSTGAKYSIERIILGPPDHIRLMLERLDKLFLDRTEFVSIEMDLRLIGRVSLTELISEIRLKVEQRPMMLKGRITKTEFVGILGSINSFGDLINGLGELSEFKDPFLPGEGGSTKIDDRR